MVRVVLRVNPITKDSAVIVDDAYYISRSRVEKSLEKFKDMHIIRDDEDNMTE